MYACVVCVCTHTCMFMPRHVEIKERLELVLSAMLVPRKSHGAKLGCKAPLLAKPPCWPWSFFRVMKKFRNYIMEGVMGLWESPESHEIIQPCWRTLWHANYISIKLWLKRMKRQHKVVLLGSVERVFEGENYQPACCSHTQPMVKHSPLSHHHTRQSWLGVPMALQTLPLEAYFASYGLTPLPPGLGL